MRNKLFILILPLLFLLGTGLFLLPQNRISVQEKRSLAVNSDISPSDLITGALSGNAEKVLKDQFYGRDTIMTSYYRIKLLCGRPFNSGSIGIPYRYLSSNVIELDDGYLINDPLFADEDKLFTASSRGWNVSELKQQYPDTDVYVYFPTRIEETIADGMLYRETFKKQLVPGIRTGELNNTTLEDHQKYFYRSDYHWNVYGAYQGYTDIIRMIAQDYDIGEPLPVGEEISFDYPFHGNISSQIGHLGKADHITDYRLSGIGEYTLTANGEVIDLNESKRRYAAEGNHTQYSDYDLYFGNNYFERIFDFKQPERPNILIFADSYVNILQEWLASHFNRTVILDLRTRPDDFSLDYYMKEYDIDLVLILEPYQDLYFNGNMFIPVY
ncbi:MAG: hypothetical protein IJJ29_03650 [Solobacterium sp.]|nr:hypothetical protein [Solobacterium sp.]